MPSNSIRNYNMLLQENIMTEKDQTKSMSPNKRYEGITSSHKNTARR